MKRMWHNCLALVAAVTMVGSANAQNDWNQQSEIGSYQSILSRAGYGNPMASGQQMMQAGVPMQGSATRTAPMMQHASPMQHSAPMMTQPRSMVQQAPVTQTPAIMNVAPANGAVGTQGCVGCAGSEVNFGAGTYVGETASYGSPMMAGSVDMGGGYATSSFDSHGYVGDTMTASPAIYNGVVSGPVAQYDCASPVYSAPVYTEAAVNTGGNASNYTVGLYGLFFQRDYEDNRYLASNPAGDELFTNDADEQNMDGYGLTLGSRRCNGGGYEVAYWALNPGQVSSSISGAAVNTNLRGLDRLTHTPSARNVFDIYTDNLSQTVTRETNINNIEFNMLRNGGRFCLRGCRSGFYEMLFGFRWFDFDENFQYLAQSDTVTYPLTPADFAYSLEARNRLLGLQLGARNEMCLTDRFRFFSGVKGGIFNNNIRTRQSIVGGDGVSAVINTGASAGRVFDYSDTKNDVAFLGELNFGILMNLTCRSRIRFGYRAIGVSGVALATDQIPVDFSDARELQSANSNGSLLLNGGYYGLEFCF